MRMHNGRMAGAMECAMERTQAHAHAQWSSGRMPRLPVDGSDHGAYGGDDEAEDEPADEQRRQAEEALRVVGRRDVAVTHLGRQGVAAWGWCLPGLL